MDNYGTHKTLAIPNWVARHARFQVNLMPTSPSWLIQVEPWFAKLTQEQIRRGIDRSTRRLEDAIRSYLNQNNADLKSFVWTKSADAILTNTERFFLRIAHSGHGVRKD